MLEPEKIKITHSICFEGPGDTRTTLIINFKLIEDYPMIEFKVINQEDGNETKITVRGIDFKAFAARILMCGWDS